MDVAYCVARKGDGTQISIDAMVASTLEYSHIMTSHLMNRSLHQQERNPAEYAVLGILVHGNAHGYDVYREVRDCLGSVHRLGRSQVYGLLSRLERDGMIVHQRIEQERVPDKKVFTPTDEGRRLLKHWIRTPVSNVRSLRVEFLIKLYFAGLESPETERSLLEAQIAVCLTRVARLESKLAAALPAIERRAFQFRLAMVRCSIEWLESMAAELTREP